jgi:hypothetical protein
VVRRQPLKLTKRAQQHPCCGNDQDVAIVQADICFWRGSSPCDAGLALPLAYEETVVMIWTTSANDRLLLSAIADRLIFGDAHTFSSDDAQELARLLPVMPGPSFLSRLLPDITAKGSLPGRSTSGSAAGVGNISINDDNFSFDVDSRGRRVVRAGQWKMIRRSDFRMGSYQ